MSAPPITVALDRTLRVRPGQLVKTGRVPCHRVRLANARMMGVGDVAEAFRRRVNHHPDDRFPPPVGYWETDEADGARTFVILDGRHEYVAALLVGAREILVAWLEEVE